MIKYSLRLKYDALWLRVILVAVKTFFGADIMADLSKLSMPVATPETQHFWEGTQEGELRLQKCLSCSDTYFPPRPFCPACSSQDVEVFTASGRATLYSYIINHRPHPAFDGPYSIAVVELEEGPRMMTNIINTPQQPENLLLDMPLLVVFRKVSEAVALPYFQPAGSAI